MLYVQPTTRPGAKLPHAWLVGSTGRRISTLDVVGKGKFTVLTGLAGTVWEKAAEAIGRPFLRTVVIGTPDNQDLYCDWREVMEIAEDGVLLVRPDGHIAWRQFAAPDTALAAQHLLQQALDAVLGASHGGTEHYAPHFGPHLFD